MYYFTYGSNMDERQIKDRCPDATFIGRGVLHDYRIAFTIFSPFRKCGCADIVREPGSSVYGLIYELTQQDLDRLDDYEGAPVHYHRITVTILDDNGKNIPCESYEVANKKEGCLPSKAYLGIMLNAAEQYDFSSDYVAILKSTRTID